MTTRRLLILVTGVLAALVLLVSPASAVSPQAHQPSLQFVGQAIVPTGTTSPARRSEVSPRSRTTRAGTSTTRSRTTSRRSTRPASTRSASTSARASTQATSTSTRSPRCNSRGRAVPAGGLDPEGLALTKDRQLILTSEGNTNTLLAPFVRRYDLAGDYLSDLPVPGYYLPTADHSTGIRFNLAFESAGVPPNGRFFFTATENALFQDGPAATPTNGSPSRILRYDLQTGKLDREYLYNTDPIFEPPVPPTQFAVNGIVELLPFNNELDALDGTLVLGRRPGHRERDQALLGRASRRDECPRRGEPRRARRQAGAEDAAFDLGSLGIPLDNVEGMTLGPKLPDGRQSLVLVSDNNFAASQFTQFLLFAISP